MGLGTQKCSGWMLPLTGFQANKTDLWATSLQSRGDQFPSEMAEETGPPTGVPHPDSSRPGIQQAHRGWALQPKSPLPW